MLFYNLHSMLNCQPGNFNLLNKLYLEALFCKLQSIVIYQQIKKNNVFYSYVQNPCTSLHPAREDVNTCISLQPTREDVDICISFQPVRENVNVVCWVRLATEFFVVLCQVRLVFSQRSASVPDVMAATHSWCGEVGLL